eukprot:CAMPEP_0115286554 /NCGR_PEP_ID=MMETSP0270-20121206/61999_1 /TAXON_ID=71861 /ORGANISM="Scrippsiella trochoidea, Strain CCMP3099" /LENGTH=37 /DNA_ID= /DNA_START= /DNA_END= /DNA_ORIENTATION=
MTKYVGDIAVLRAKKRKRSSAISSPDSSIRRLPTDLA